MATFGAETSSELTPATCLIRLATGARALLAVVPLGTLAPATRIGDGALGTVCLARCAHMSGSDGALIPRPGLHCDTSGVIRTATTATGECIYAWFPPLVHFSSNMRARSRAMDLVHHTLLLHNQLLLELLCLRRRPIRIAKGPNACLALPIQINCFIWRAPRPTGTRVHARSPRFARRSQHSERTRSDKKQPGTDARREASVCVTCQDIWRLNPCEMSGASRGRVQGDLHRISTVGVVHCRPEA